MLTSNNTQTNTSINSSSFSLNFNYCSDSKGGFFISLAFAITNVFLLLPLSLLVLYLGLQRCRQKRCLATTSHSDFFTYHLAVMELIFVLSFAFHIFGSSLGLKELTMVSTCAYSAFYPGQMYIHILTCVDRYLAVIHPITYMGLRQSGGVRIRNVSIGCVWLLYCGWIGVEALYYPHVPYASIFCFLVLCLVVVSFCSLSVLCVLIRPGPRIKGKDIPRGNQAKRRAFHTIMAITGALWLFFLGVCVCVALVNSSLLSYNDGCLLLASGSWFTLPSSLVLPLLFLQRAGKLMRCHCGAC